VTSPYSAKDPRIWISHVRARESTWDSVTVRISVWVRTLLRVEMQVAWPRLFECLPNIRLAVPYEQLEFEETSITYGLRSLPVRW
jgi:hypothetical protein